MMSRYAIYVINDLINYIPVLVSSRVRYFFVFVFDVHVIVCVVFAESSATLTCRYLKFTVY
jgi:hypothetical protein